MAGWRAMTRGGVKRGHELQMQQGVNGCGSRTSAREARHRRRRLAEWRSAACRLKTVKCSRCSEVKRFSSAVFSKNFSCAQNFGNTKVVEDSRSYKFSF